MVNMWAFEEAVDLAKSAPFLGVGLHFTLAAGRPISRPEKVSSLVSRDGLFHSRSLLVSKLLKGKISLDEVKRELYAQIEKLEKYGIKADHIDGDKHVHILPGVSRIVTDVAIERGRIAVRIPDEQIVANLNSIIKPRNSRALAALLFRKFWSKQLKHQLTQAMVASNDGFISLFGLVPRRIPTMEDIELLLLRVRNGVTEFMVHPGLYDKRYGDFFGSESLAKEREVEFRLLLSEEFRRMLKRLAIRLRDYGAVNVSKTTI